MLTELGTGNFFFGTGDGPLRPRWYDEGAASEEEEEGEEEEEEEEGI